MTDPQELSAKNQSSTSWEAATSNVRLLAAQDHLVRKGNCSRRSTAKRDSVAVISLLEGTDNVTLDGRSKLQNFGEGCLLLFRHVGVDT
jgi:hypothetical protein